MYEFTQNPLGGVQDFSFKELGSVEVGVGLVGIWKVSEFQDNIGVFVGVTEEMEVLVWSHCHL